MNVNLGIWDKLSKVVLFLTLVAVGLGVFQLYLPLIQKNQRYRKEIISLDTKITDEEKRSRQIRGAIDSLQNDPRAVEKMTREKLGWARTNEMVVRFEQPVGAERRR